MKAHTGKDWFWYQMGPQERDKARDLIHFSHWPQCEKWFENNHHINFLRVDTTETENEAVFGSIIYDQGLGEEKDHTVFHFYITRQYFFTINFDFSILNGIKGKQVVQQMERADSTMEGFLILLSELMNAYLIGLDEFEVKLRKLRWQIKDDNSKSILNRVHLLHHELMIWKNLILNTKKIEMALKETFLSQHEDKKVYQRTQLKIDRGFTYISEFEGELNSLLHSEEVITSHRGNEIFKALTIFTTLFTPVTALGALWGMNFSVMPELNWKYGYLLSLLLIGTSTVLIYLYLKKKGWTGDMLQEGKKKKKSQKRQTL
ncbi:magnesium transporter CorA family protein [Bacillus vallismortis]|uniref:Magnesium transporter CorA family protein n=1 Tax=Bacillus vallismortis TaxID=72361 RepID=A0ABY4XVP0_BACVA|nr:MULTISPECIES: magnesium transporter CorA family protein [Bacillus subtilis group]MDM5302469.1 magnesium transporter CorA family protein [Bacillus subtilis]MDM5324522.1 magnesium transporter CorA family protein [Bacillus subtilis]USP94056.1 magnesium transporter CorA family protein [Bacillus vallismortis]